MFTPEEMQQQAQRLKAMLDERAVSPRAGRYALATCQELVARALGAAHWHEAHKNAQRSRERAAPGTSWSVPVRPLSLHTNAKPTKANRERWSRWPAHHLLNHTLLLGAAGSGRTSALKTLALTARDASRGLIWINTGPDMSVKSFLAEHNVGRLSTVQHLNFVHVSPNEEHRFNPAAWMKADDLTAWLEALGQGRLVCPQGWSLPGWHERSVRVWAAVVPILARRRDEHGALLNLDVLLEAISWDGLNRLWTSLDLLDDERAALRRYLSPWFTSSEAPAFVAPVAPAWAGVFGSLRTIGPHLDGSHTLPGQAIGGSLYDVIEQRETLVVSVPAQWRSPDDPRALAYDAFLLALVQVLRTHGPGMRSLDPSRPLPWRTTLVLENAGGMERFDPSLLEAARARGVALVLSYQDRDDARKSGVSENILHACQTVLQMRTESPLHAQDVVFPPGVSEREWAFDLKDQRAGEAWVQGAEASNWIAFDLPDR